MTASRVAVGEGRTRWEVERAVEGVRLRAADARTGVRVVALIAMGGRTEARRDSPSRPDDVEAVRAEAEGAVVPSTFRLGVAAEPARPTVGEAIRLSGLTVAADKSREPVVELDVCESLLWTRDGVRVVDLVRPGSSFPCSFSSTTAVVLTVLRARPGVEGVGADEPGRTGVSVTGACVFRWDQELHDSNLRATRSWWSATQRRRCAAAS